MQNNANVKKNVLTVVLIAIITMAIAFGFSLWLTPQNKATSKLIVVFNQQGIDAYTASKNSSYITGILSEVVYSNSFIGNVYENNYGLKDDLGYGQDQRLKTWRKRVSIKTQDTKGIIIVETFNNDRNQAYQLNQNIISMLIAKHGLYDGLDDQATLKIIDSSAIVENWYQIQIIQNSLIGLALGLFLGFSLIVVFPRQQVFKMFSNEYNSLVTKDETFGLDGSGDQFVQNYTPYNSQWMDYSIYGNEQNSQKTEE